MKNHKTIEETFESWGKSKREVPKGNDALKSEILAKAEMPFAVTPSFRYHRLPWMSFAFGAMAVLVLVVGVTNNTGTGTFGRQFYQDNSDGSSVGSSTIAIPTIESGGDYKIAPSLENSYLGGLTYYEEEVAPISDDREFLKTSYHATLRTRHADILTARVETIVRGFGGRVDSVNSGEKWGSVSFALPKENLFAFQAQVKNLVPAVFYTEETSSENLLPQKQSIEESEERSQKNLDALKTERAGVVKSHNQNISLYQSSINSKNIEVITLNNEYPSANTLRQTEITNRISLLQAEINTLKSKIANENTNYQGKIAKIDGQIKSTQTNLEAIQKQDIRLIDNVATVNGSISLSWISFWEMADLYLPGSLLFYIFLAIAVISYLWHRRFTRMPDYF